MPVTSPLAAAFLPSAPSAPPPELQWLGLFLAFLSVPALLLALPLFLDRQFGAPSIVLRFSTRDLGDTHVLECQVFNPPVEHPLLRRLGVRRRDAEIHAVVLVREYETERYVVESSPVISLMGAGRSTTQRVTLRESRDPALIAIAAYDRGQNLFDPLGERLPLMPGGYWADVNVEYDATSTLGRAAFEVPEGGEVRWRPG